MKHTKKLLALLLTALLAFALAAPAMAVDRDDITITGPTSAVPFGQAFTLSVSVELPDGTEIESYQWKFFYGSSQQIEGATDSILRVAPGQPAYPKGTEPFWPAQYKYSCSVTLAEKDAQGNTVGTQTIDSLSFDVTVGRERKMNFGEMMKYAAVEGAGFVAMTSFLSAFLLLPLAPITFLIGFFLAFSEQLFS